MGDRVGIARGAGPAMMLVDPFRAPPCVNIDASILEGGATSTRVPRRWERSVPFDDVWKVSLERSRSMSFMPMVGPHHGKAEVDYVSRGAVEDVRVVEDLPRDRVPHRIVDERGRDAGDGGSDGDCDMGQG